MGHAKALLIKFAAFAALLYLVLPMGGVALTAGALLLLSVALTLVAYLLGDLLVLPAAGNLVAVAADAILAMVILWAGTAMLTGTAPLSTLLIATVLLGVFEFFFHRYLLARGIVPAPGKAGAPR